METDGISSSRQLLNENLPNGDHGIIIDEMKKQQQKTLGTTFLAQNKALQQLNSSMGGSSQSMVILNSTCEKMLEQEFFGNNSSSNATIGHERLHTITKKCQQINGNRFKITPDNIIDWYLQRRNEINKEKQLQA